MIERKINEFGKKRNNIGRLKIGRKPREYNITEFKEREIFKEDRRVNNLKATENNNLKATENEDWVKH